ncbi:YhgE/Pip domain-containing protein [Latilactobacillus curvatus]|uniref:YhgE/Pip domain-containing protein n=1 Tax=Latilactobacillus curvatus TaxID=28038 RepID=UPI000B61EA37|nr:YhgE/Pip domain-containing protein [Latilactobacillus curvatus]ASN61244.1 ABC transporter [Latilactobacillus curvatus]MCT2879438.1 YhgE/Pip domain-containing protein [Latilactobacillus curvatus]
MKMIQNEFKFIAKNRLIMISLIAIVFIPFLYSIFFLKSVWDPYGSTGELPVAVVNNDQPATYNGETLSAGKDMVKELKKNDQLGWRFVSAKKAQQGLKDKEYYTVVTLPKNFSANAATVLDKNPKKMQIQYKTNDSLNFIGEVISEMGAKELNAQVRETVTNAYAKVMFKQVKTAGKGFSTAAKGAKQLTDGSVTLSDGLNVYTAGVAQVNDGIMTMKTSVVPLSDGVKQLADGSNTLNNGLLLLNSKTGALASGASQLNSGASQLNTGLQTLNSKAPDLSNGVTKLSTGLNTLNGSSSQLVNGVSQLDGGTDQLIDGSQKLNVALTDVAQTIDNQLETGAPGIDQLTSRLTQVNDVIQQLYAGINNPATDQISNQVTADLTSIATNTASTGSSLQQVNTKLYDQDSSASAASQVANTGAQLKAITEVVSDPQIQAALGSNPALAQKLTSALQSAGASVAATGNQLASSGTDVNSIKANTLDNKAHLKSIQTQMTALMQSLAQLKRGINGIAPVSPVLKDRVNSAINQLTGGLAAVSAGLTRTGNTPETMGPIQATATINAGLRQMKLGLVGTPSQMGLIPGLNAYTVGVSQASAGTNQLNGQIPALTGGVSQLATGSAALAAGTGALNAQVPQLTSGISQLATGSTALNNGLGQLNGQIPTLTSGVDQLAAGTNQLTDNSAKLTDGAGQLTDGNKTLASALKSGANEVNSIQLTDKTADMFAAPAELKHSNYSYVPNYGHALAPYVLSVALFVGAIVFNFAYPIRKISMTGQSSTAWFLSKITVGALVAVGMAIIEPALMMVAGLNVDHPAQFFLMAITFSLASMSIIMFLSMIFDNPGRFLAMVLLMLQLGGSGGTFPMEITNHFYNVIHPFLPMTYSILGLREAITSGLGTGQIVQSFFVLLAFIVVALLLLWLGMNHLQKIGNGGRSQLDDNQKLQDVEK